MYRGRLVADADPASVTPEELGSAMTGAAAGHLEHGPAAEGPKAGPTVPKQAGGQSSGGDR
jgi:simple sugar transport system ATP-binding protein